MLVTKTIAVSFEVPKDNDDLSAFRGHEDLSEWEEIIAGPYVTYTMKQPMTYEISNLKYLTYV